MANNVGERLAGCATASAVLTTCSPSVRPARTATSSETRRWMPRARRPRQRAAARPGRAVVATPTDFFGCARPAPPDIGAIEFGACPAPAATALLPATAGTTPAAQPRAKLRARIASVRAWRLARRVVVVVPRRQRAERARRRRRPGSHRVEGLARGQRRRSAPLRPARAALGPHRGARARVRGGRRSRANDCARRGLSRPRRPRGRRRRTCGPRSRPRCRARG